MAARFVVPHPGDAVLRVRLEPEDRLEHDALARRTVERHRGTVVKMTGDGLYAAFEDPLDAVGATIELQQVLDDPAATEGIALRVRCGMHAGVVERRDNDYFGSSVNRAARKAPVSSRGWPSA